MGDETRTFWATWHDAYDDPESDLSHRLIAVQRRLAEAIRQAPPGEVRIISACAGQGHDVLGVLETHPRASDVRAWLVEDDDHNVLVARRRVTAAGVRNVHVVQADAGFTGTYRDAVPAHILLLCGITGNVNDADLQRLIANASRLCAPGAIVLWTRHRRDPDRTPELREWFAAAGYQELAFDSPGPDRFALGTIRLDVPPLPYVADLQLFTFTPWHGDSDSVPGA